MANGNFYAANNGWRAKLWQGLVLLFGLYVLQQNFSFLTFYANDMTRHGNIGANYFNGVVIDGKTYDRVGSVTRGSPLDKAGVASGGLIRFDRQLDYQRYFEPKESIGLTHYSVKGSHHMVLTASHPFIDASQRTFINGALLQGLVTLVISLLGLFIVLRSRRHPLSMAIGLAFLSAGLNFPRDLWQNTYALTAWVRWVTYVFYALESLFYLHFARLFYEEYNSVHTSGMTFLNRIFFTANVLLLSAMGHDLFMPDYNNLWLGHSEFKLSIYLGVAGIVLASAYRVLGWIKARPASKSRYHTILAAGACLMIAMGVQSIDTRNLSLSNWFIWLQQSANILAPALFAYGVLRHKVIDLGFAINRTLVYGIVSFLILMVFGLAEWGLEKLLPKEHLEANALVSAGIALSIFLVFHRVRDFVEHHVETIFFKSWHDNEARLKRFGREASHIQKPDALMSAFIAELSRFSGRAAAALYLPNEAKDYVLKTGGITGLATILDPDLSELVRLRAELKALEPEGEGVPNAALLLPMVHRNALTGIAVLAAKPTGNGYRPDEIEALSHATLQIGLDLHALKIEALEAEAAKLRQDLLLSQTGYQALEKGLMAR